MFMHTLVSNDADIIALGEAFLDRRLLQGRLDT
jgi:hypothetical protein